MGVEPQKSAKAVKNGSAWRASFLVPKLLPGNAFAGEARLHARGAHSSRVLVLASRQNELSRRDAARWHPHLHYATPHEVRVGGTPPPARGTRALPGTGSPRSSLIRHPGREHAATTHKYTSPHPPADQSQSAPAHAPDAPEQASGVCVLGWLVGSLLRVGVLLAGITGWRWRG